MQFYRMSRWKVSKIKQLYLRILLLYTFVGYTTIKGNYQSFSEYITFSTNFSMGFLGAWTNIQTIQHVWCYHSHSVPYAGFQVLQVIDLNLVDSVLHITPQEKIQWQPRRPSNWSTSANSYPSHLSVQVIPNMMAEMWQRMRVSWAWKKETYRVFLSNDIN